MKCWVTPITGYNIEPRYRVKCVVVESERIFKDITIAPRNSADLLPIYKNKRQNLIRHYMEGPNFYELNRLVNFDTKCRSITTMRPNRNSNMDINMLIRTKLSKYFLIEKNHDEDNSFLKTLECSKIYRHPEIIMKQEIVVLSLINQLLIDIYGYSNNSKNRFKNKSINSLRLRQYSRPYLQRSQLELKCTSELQTIVKSISEHINHINGFLIHQLLRREYLQTKRKGFYNVVTAYLLAHSNKESKHKQINYIKNIFKI
ncbi:PREDICTED: uncharacterized protein LOC105359919 [Ceratosolen solmsi marchali]|uniref:Uncharacterized protein LOC105359919 n=1 Tax=Ceratosolen solmsi marchali TaxID=326594 RepID=A0AAJ6VLK8_9HYME|nr:PREDICTED: uncharacterized protein LOC105359919 [Ceratosolen solmsi marchali]